MFPSASQVHTDNQASYSPKEDGDSGLGYELSMTVNHQPEQYDLVSKGHEGVEVRA